MGCNTQEKGRMVPKRSFIAGTRATIPATNDHSLGGWLTTDIYPGEQLYNVVDGISWTRATIDGVDQILTIDGYTDIYKAVLNQAGTANPIAYNAHGSLAILWTRSALGVYLGTLTGAFPSNRTIVLFPDMGQPTQQAHYEWVDADNIKIKTTTAGAAADDIITKLGIFVGILPIQTPAS